MIAIGDKAPDFTLQDGYGQTVRLSDFQGQKNVILYFYPKDDTPGCTLEAQGFNNSRAAYEALSTIVLGVSKDTAKSHQKFCRKYGLQITLLADPEHLVIEQYGAWQLRKFMGREYMGTVRSTFLISKDGIVKAVWPNVTPKDHEQEVLEAVQQLST